MSLNGSENNCMSVDKQQENNKKIVGKPFVKGQSGNPKGRPKKGLALTDLINSTGDSPGKDCKSNKQVMIEKLYTMAVNGDFNAIRFIVERLEGKAVERTADVTDKWHDIVASAYSETE